MEQKKENESSQTSLKSEDEDYENDAVYRWRMTAENAIGCHMGYELDERNCQACEGLSHCLNYHEETLAALCIFIADLIEGSGGEVKNKMVEQIKKASEKALFGEKKPKRDVNYYS